MEGGREGGISSYRRSGVIEQAKVIRFLLGRGVRNGAVVETELSFISFSFILRYEFFIYGRQTRRGTTGNCAIVAMMCWDLGFCSYGS